MSDDRFSLFDRLRIWLVARIVGRDCFVFNAHVVGDLEIVTAAHDARLTVVRNLAITDHGFDPLPGECDEPESDWATVH